MRHIGGDRCPLELCAPNLESDKNRTLCPQGPYREVSSHLERVPHFDLSHVSALSLWLWPLCAQGNKPISKVQLTTSGTRRSCVKSFLSSDLLCWPNVVLVLHLRHHSHDVGFNCSAKNFVFVINNCVSRNTTVASLYDDSRCCTNTTGQTGRISQSKANTTEADSPTSQVIYWFLGDPHSFYFPEPDEQRY